MDYPAILVIPFSDMNVTCFPRWMIDTQSFTIDVKWDVFDNIVVNNIKMFDVAFRQYNEDLSDQVYFRVFTKPIIVSQGFHLLS